MLKLSANIKTVPFEFEENGKTTELYVTQHSVADANYLLELQKPLVNDDKNMSYEDFVVSRIIASVKRKDDDSRYWDCSVEDFKQKTYPNDLVTELNNVINELNPLPIVNEESNDSVLEQKKSKS